MNNINFGHLGNGITVFDTNKKEHGDYKCIAFINPDRSIEFRDKKLNDLELIEIIHYSFVKNPYTDMSHVNLVFKEQAVYRDLETYKKDLQKEIMKYKIWAASNRKYYKNNG